MGMKVGTTVVKSGGTLKAELAGALRDGLRKSTTSYGTMREIGRAASHSARAVEGGKLNKWQAAQAGEAAAKAAIGTAKTAARVASKPVDTMLRNAENWKKAGVVESMGVRVQLAIENKLAERRAVKELESKVATAEKAKADECAPNKEKPKAAERAPEGREVEVEKEKGADRALDRPETPIELEARVAELAASQPELRVLDKAAGRGRELERGR